MDDPRPPGHGGGAFPTTRRKDFVTPDGIRVAPAITFLSTLV
ncbi:MAG: hypothetical protein ACRD6R_06525 [Candidatus Polarisedimenticolia bacterium]